MPESDYTPEVVDVAYLLRARTKDSGGNETGTFGAETRPTSTEVEAIITRAVGKLSTIIGDNIPDALFAEAKETAAIRAAMIVELSYWPEQINTDRSPYGRLKELWDEAIGIPGKPGSLVVAIQQATNDDIVDVQGSGSPAGYVVAGETPSLIGWGTKW